MGKITYFAELPQVDPANLEEYLERARTIGAESVSEEPGVIAIFPMQDKRNPGKIRILEIYEDEAAYQAHLQTPHFLTYKISTLSMVEKLDLVDMNPLDEAAMPLIFKKLAERK